MKLFGLWVGCIAAVATAAWLLWTPTDSAVQPGAELLVQAEAVPAQSDVPMPLSVIRTPAPWLPDGRVWIRALDDKGEIVSELTATWVDPDARFFLPVQEAERREDGWHVVPAVSSKVLAVISPGYSVAWCSVSSTEVRHEVLLRAETATSVIVRDEMTGRPVDGVAFAISEVRVPESCPPDGVMPGPVPKTAIHVGRSDENGVVRVSSGARGRPMHYDVWHDHFCPSAASGETMTLTGAQAECVVVQPLKGAITIRGDRLLYGSVSVLVRHSPERRSSWFRLESIREDMQQRWPGALTVAFLPSPRTAYKATAKAKLEQSGELRFDVDLLASSDFIGPQEVVLTPDPAIVPVVADVTVNAPPSFADGVEIDSRIMITGGGTHLVGRFGDTFRLAPGEYRVQAMGFANAALARDVFKVDAGEPQAFQTRWREGTTCHVFRISSQAGAALSRVVVLRQGDDGREYGMEVLLNDDGVGHLWLQRREETVRLHADGHVRATVTAVPDQASPRVLHFVATLSKRDS